MEQHMGFKHLFVCEAWNEKKKRAKSTIESFVLSSEAKKTNKFTKENVQRK